MASVLNRTTKEYRTSVNTPEFSTADWIIEPELSAVVGFAKKYWTITGDAVTLMSAGQRAAVDAAELSAAHESTASTLDQVDGIERAFAQVVLDALKAQDAVIAAATSLANLQSRWATMAADHTLPKLRAATLAKLGT